MFYEEELKNFNENIAVRCPACGFEYVHPTEIYVNSGGVITVVKDSGTYIKRGSAVGRGVSYGIKYVCESGHVFVARFQFNKGNTYTEIINVGELPPEEWPSVIWRD